MARGPHKKHGACKVRFPPKKYKMTKTSIYIKLIPNS